jgi:hypothetical protein
MEFYLYVQLTSAKAAKELILMVLVSHVEIRKVLQVMVEDACKPDAGILGNISYHQEDVFNALLIREDKTIMNSVLQITALKIIILSLIMTVLVKDAMVEHLQMLLKGIALEPKEELEIVTQTIFAHIILKFVLEEFVLIALMVRKHQKMVQDVKKMNANMQHSTTLMVDVLTVNLTQELITMVIHVNLMSVRHIKNSLLMEDVKIVTLILLFLVIIRAV